MKVLYHVGESDVAFNGDLNFEVCRDEDYPGAAKRFARELGLSRVSVLSDTQVTPSARAVPRPRGGGKKYVCFLWGREERQGVDEELWASIFEAANQHDAARNAYLERFCQNRDTRKEIEDSFKHSDFRFSLQDIDARSLSEIVEEHIDTGTGGYQPYLVSHFIRALDELPVGQRFKIEGKDPSPKLW